MIRASHIVTAVIVLLTILPGMVLGFTDEIARETLRGIKGVRVAVGVIKPEIERDGLSRDQILTDVELKLRMARLNVLTSEDGYSDKAFLVVTPHILKHHELSSQLQGDMYLFSIYLELYQAVYLMRNKKRTLAITWSTGIYYGIDSDLDKIRRRIKDQVDVFLNAWLSVNPK